MNRDWLIGIGAQKCASTWLYDILVDHPQVAASREKETDFFSYHYGRGFQWYEDRFPVEHPGCIRAEISPSYLIDGDAPARVRAFAPGARILVSLRDPVERAISNHRHEVRLGNLRGPDLSFEAGLRNNPLYLEQSRYGTHLQRWLCHFPVSRLLILFQEDIDADPHAVARQVYGFLGVDAMHVSAALAGRSNESHCHRFDGLERLRQAARAGTRRIGLDGAWRLAQRAGLQGLYRRFNRRPSASRIPPVAAETRHRLAGRLEEEIRLVEELTGRALPQWRQPDPAGLERVAVGAEVRPAIGAC